MRWDRVEADAARRTAGWWPVAPALLLFAAIAAISMLPAAMAPPMSHDSFWIDRVWAEQFTHALGRGQLYPRWLPLSFGGLGAPVFYFYAPLSFHITGLFGLAGLDTYPALLAAFGATWFGSGATMYLWLRRRARAPAIGAALYMVLPYHVIDFYARGALGEFCAFAMVPLVALGLREAAERSRPLPLALAYGALIMTHLPTAVIVSTMLIAPFSLHHLYTHRTSLRPLAMGVAGGLGSAAVYLLPALTLQRHSALGSLWSVRFLQPESWSLLRPDLWGSASYVLLFAGLAGTTAVAALLLMRRMPRFWPVWTAAVCLVSAGLIPGFWTLPVMKAVQFPWRSLVLAEFGLATVVASYRGSPVIAAAAVTPLLAMSLMMMSPANPLHGDPMRPLPIPGMQDVIEYLPPELVDPGREPKLAPIAAAVRAKRDHPTSVFPFPSLRAQCPTGATVPLQADPTAAHVAAPPPGCSLIVAPLPAERIGWGVSLATWLILALAGLNNRAAARTIRPACRAWIAGWRAAPSAARCRLPWRRPGQQAQVRASVPARRPWA